MRHVVFLILESILGTAQKADKTAWTLYLAGLCYSLRGRILVVDQFGGVSW